MGSVTIRDIAKALNVAPSTVSSCLSGDAKRRMSRKRIEQVRRKAEEMGYIPNMLAKRIFRRNNRKYLGIVISTDTAMVRTQIILNGLLSGLSRRDDCDFSVLYAPGNNLCDALKTGVGLGINDFIITGYLRGYDLQQLPFEKLPPVNIYAANYYFDSSDMECPRVRKKIGFNRSEYYRALENFLNASGHGPVVTVRAVEEGQRQDEIPDGIRYRVADVVDAFTFGCEKVAPPVLETIASGQCRTLLLRSDSLAVGVMDRLLREKVRIPGDVAVIGFDNDPFSPYAKVPLTTVALSLTESVQNLISHILDGAELPDVVQQHPTLIIRDSTPPEWDWSGCPGAFKREQGHCTR